MATKTKKKTAAKAKPKRLAREPEGAHLICTFEQIAHTYNLRLAEVQKRIAEASFPLQKLKAPEAPWITGFLSEDVVEIFGQPKNGKPWGYQVRED
jgi:hypothetical protein